LLEYDHEVRADFYFKVQFAHDINKTEFINVQ
jgi:hypothetical protein